MEFIIFQWIRTTFVILILLKHLPEAEILPTSLSFGYLILFFIQVIFMTLNKPINKYMCIFFVLV